MKFEPISVAALDQTESAPTNVRARELARAVCGCRADDEPLTASAYELTLCPELARHVILYATILSTSVLRKIEELHPEQFGIKADGISLAGSARSWRDFLLSPQVRASRDVYEYLTPTFARRLPEIFCPGERPDDAFPQSEMERDIAEHVVNIYDSSTEWERHLRRDVDTRLACSHHTLLVEADAFTLYPLSRLLEARGVATLTPTDVWGAVTEPFEDSFESPETPALSEPWFRHEEGSPESEIFEESAYRYAAVRERQVAVAARACMPAMTRTRLLVTATEREWNDVLSFGFLPWAASTERMTNFYHAVLRECGYALFELTEGRVGNEPPHERLALAAKSVSL